MKEKSLNSGFIEPMEFDDEKKKPMFLDDEQKLIKPMEFDVKTKGVEEKLYIILYKIVTDEEFDQIFEICIGRTEAYTDIKDKLQSGLDIDVHASKIITETKQTETATMDRKYYLIPYEDCISVYAFCKSVENYYDTDEFDIEEYNNTDVPEEDPILSKSTYYMTPEMKEYQDMLKEALTEDRFTNAILNNDNK